MCFSLVKRRALRLLFAGLVFMSNSVWSADPHIGIVIFDGVLSSDVTAPAEVFGIASRQAWFKDYKVAFISVENKSTITTEEGLVLKPDYHIGNSPPLDVLILPSRYDMNGLYKNQQLTDFIQSQSQKVSWLASNCSGATLLANAGLLDGKRATTWAGGEKAMQKQYPKVKVIDDQNLVVDGNIITSNGSIVSYQAALVLLAKMSSPERAQEVFDALQMGRVVSWESISDFLKD